MGLFTEHYLNKLFLAFVVVILSYYVGRIASIWNKNRKRRRHKRADLSLLIQHEIFRFSGNIRSSSSRMVKKKSHTTSHKVIRIYEIKIKALEESNKDHEQIEDLKKSIKLFKATLSNNPNPFKSILNSVHNISKSSIPLRDILKTSQSFLEENIFIFSEEQREVMSYQKVKNLIIVKTLLDTFIQDTLLESSTICKIIERGNK